MSNLDEIKFACRGGEFLTTDAHLTSPIPKSLDPDFSFWMSNERNIEVDF